MTPTKQIDKDYIIKHIRDGFSIISIARNLGVSRNLIHSRLKDWGLDHQQIKFNHHFFNSIDSEEKSYWLGFLMADGCVSITQKPKVVLHLANKDLEHLYRFLKALDSCIKPVDHKDGSSSVSHYSSDMCRDLIHHGCVSRKSLILQFPELHQNLISHFVRGYFDGDGSIGWKNNHTQPQITILGTEQFLLKIREVIGTSANVRPRNSSRAYNICIGGKIQVKRILNWMYSDATIYLPRKKDVVADLLEV